MGIKKCPIKLRAFSRMARMHNKLKFMLIMMNFILHTNLKELFNIVENFFRCRAFEPMLNDSNIDL